MSDLAAFEAKWKSDPKGYDREKWGRRAAENSTECRTKAYAARREGNDAEALRLEAESDKWQKWVRL